MIDDRNYSVSSITINRTKKSERKKTLHMHTSPRHGYTYKNTKNKKK